MRTTLTILCSMVLVLGLGCVLPPEQIVGDDDDDTGDDDTGDDDTGDDDTGDDDTGDDDTGDDDTGDDDTGDDDTGDDDTGDDDTGDDDTGDDDSTPGPALFIEDVDQWGYAAWADEFLAQGVPYVTIGSAGLANTNLDLHSMVVTTSVQGSTYNQALLAKLTDFQDYVTQGGVLIWSGCTWEEHTPYPDPPFGGTNTYLTADMNQIVDPAHPLMVDVVAPFTGNSASHNYFAGIPGPAQVILTDPDNGEATLYVLELGSGLLIVSGIPWEFQGGDAADSMQTLVNAVTYGWGYP